MRRFTRRLAIGFSLVSIFTAGLNAETNTTVSAGVSEARVETLKNLRFGMFISWSFSTFSGKEWTPGVTNLSNGCFSMMVRTSLADNAILVNICYLAKNFINGGIALFGLIPSKS